MCGQPPLSKSRGWRSSDRVRVDSVEGPGATSMQPSDNRERYLDLLIRVLANTIYEDPSRDPWHSPVFDAERRNQGRDWPRNAHTMIGVTRLRHLRELVQRTLDGGIAGD